MANAPKKVIQKIRHKFKPPEKAEPLWKKLKAEHDARVQAEKIWEHDKEIVRDANFKKAQAGLQIYRESVEAEKERQRQIAEDRLKNLKKARKVLQETRSTE